MHRAEGVDDLLHLAETSISTLDLQDNKIWDPDVLPEVFVRMADLRVLYLKGNPCSKKIPNYRKGITAVCLNLKLLGDIINIFVSLSCIIEYSWRLKVLG